MQNQDMYYQNDDKQVDWDDGKIHTVVQGYDINDPKHWNKNVSYRPQDDMSPQYIKGSQKGFLVVTNDPRIVIPAYIIGSVIFIIITMILFAFEMTRFMGVFSAIILIIFWVATLKQNIPTWIELSKTLKNDKNKK